MYNESLRDNIRAFICRFGRVDVAQVNTMFRDRSPDAVKWHIKMLRKDNIIKQDENGCLVSVNKSATNEKFSSDHLQYMVTKSAWIISSFGEKNIASFYVAQYPTQVVFATNDGRAFDITVIHPQTAGPTVQMAARIFKSFVPAKEEDAIGHIALISHKELIEKTKNFNVFDYYALVLPDNTVSIKSFDGEELFRGNGTVDFPTDECFDEVGLT